MNKYNNINEDNFDKSIRQHLSNATVEPSPELWERIEGSLEAEAVPVIPLLRRVRWAMAAVAAVVVIALGSIFWLELDRSSLVLPEEVFAILEEAEEFEEIETPEEIILEAEPISLAEYRPRVALPEAEAEVEVETVEATPLQEATITIEEAEEVSEVSEQPKESATTKTKEEAPQEDLSKYYNMVSFNSPTTSSSRFNLSLMVAGSTISSATSSISSAISTQGSIVNDASISPPGDPDVALPDSGLADGNEEEETKASSPTRYDDLELLNYGSSYDIEHQVPVTFAISAAYKLTEKWSLESGLSYSYLASTITTKYNSSTRQQVEFIGVPLRLNYQIYSTPKFSLYAGAGGQLERCIGAKINSIDAIEKDWHWSLGGSVGAQYNVNDWLGIYAEPEAAYYLTETYLNTIRTENPLSFNIRFGLRFSFGASR